SVTSINRSSSGSTSGPFLTQHYSYNAGGTIAGATDVNGTVTSYNYDPNTSCNGAFPTKVNAGGLITQYTYNSTAGVTTSVTDPNGAVASTSYSDAYFWRPASSTDALGNPTTYRYISPTQVESVMNFNGTNSTRDELITLDGLGRAILDQKRQAPGS